MGQIFLNVMAWMGDEHSGPAITGAAFALHIGIFVTLVAIFGILHRAHKYFVLVLFEHDQMWEDYTRRYNLPVPKDLHRRTRAMATSAGRRN